MNTNYTDTVKVTDAWQSIANTCNILTCYSSELESAKRYIGFVPWNIEDVFFGIKSIWNRK